VSRTLNPEGYAIGKCLRAGLRSEVYGALRESDRRDVVLKVYLPVRSGLPEDVRAKRELASLQAAAGSGVPAALDLLSNHGSPVLVLERVEGVRLEQWVRESLPAPGPFLDVALQLTSTLARVHGMHLIHRDITPANIMVDPFTLKTHLVDFGLSKPLGAVTRSPETSSGIEALDQTLRYAAPEQTGRMNRGCDARSDLYSLGATFYHALTGRAPFEGDDPLQLIHAHLARLPQRPVELRVGLSEALSRIVMKLLEKEPESRYQTARALHADLAECRDQLLRSGTIADDLVLGSAEAPERPCFSRKLYGRAREIEQLQKLFATTREGAARAMLIEGEPGVGKSLLVDVLRPVVAASGGYLAVGRFDSYRERPHAGWIAALGSLVQQFLVESDARLAIWKRELGDALGSIAQALIGLVPDLAFVLDDVPPLPTLGSSETQARLSLALQRFVAACARPDRPLVILLDDLQWSDAASLALLEDLLASEHGRSLLVLGTCRSPAAGEEHPLEGLFQNLEERKVSILERMLISPLEEAATAEMLAEALERPIADTTPLAQRVIRKTGGSPLLTQEFVLHLHDQGVIRSAHPHGWTWDERAVESAAVPEGAVALLVPKLERLDAKTREIVELASCIGDPFDAESLVELSGRSTTHVEPGLFELAEQGIITPGLEGFRFAHERVREAAQSLISSHARAKLHYDIAVLLLSRSSESEQRRRVFEIADHLNRGLVYVGDELRLTAIRLNAMAGDHALSAGAASDSATYFRVARRLFRESDWVEHAALAFDVHLKSARSAHQSEDFDTALAVLDEIDRRASLSRFDRAQVAAERILVLQLTRSPDDCVSYVLQVLSQMGIDWPAHPAPWRARLALRSVSWTMRGRSLDQVLRPNPQPDFDELAKLLVIGTSAAVMLRSDVYLAMLVTCFALRMFMRHGYVRAPGLSLAAYAGHRYFVLGDPEQARKDARAAIDWNERIYDPVFGLMTESWLVSSIDLWLVRRRQALGPFTRLSERARENGDQSTAYYVTFQNAVFLALAGDRVCDSESRLRALAENCARAGHRYAEIGYCQQAVATLLDPERAHRLEDELARRTEHIGVVGAEPQGYSRTLWQLVFCVYRRFDLAYAETEALGVQLTRVPPGVALVDHTFHHGLAVAQLATSARGAERRRYSKLLKADARRLQRWAHGGPDFVHMHHLLEAERARLAGDVARACDLYVRAARRAVRQEFPHHAALAEELRARLLSDVGREADSLSALAESLVHYRKWGCDVKVDDLEAEIAQSSHWKVRRSKLDCLGRD